MKKTLGTLAIAGLLIVAASGPGLASPPDQKGCPGVTSGNNLYWPHFWVLGLLLGRGIIPGQWVTGDGGCLPQG